jgi:hypothetical protein
MGMRWLPFPESGCESDYSGVDRNSIDLRAYRMDHNLWAHGPRRGLLLMSAGQCIQEPKVDKMTYSRHQIY